MLCLTQGTLYDAGPLEGGPGQGGCIQGETCSQGLSPTDFPPWLSLCAP